MATRPFDPVQEITSSGRVLFSNLLLAAPNVVAFLVPGIIVLVFGGYAVIGAFMSPSTFMNPGAIGALFTATLIFGFALAALLFIGLSLLATGAVYGGSADALAGRPVDFASMLASGLKHAGSVFVYFLIICGVVLVAEFVVFLLAAISHGILGILGALVCFAAGIYAAFLLIYGLPALVVGGKSPIDAMAESANLARANVNSTLILVLACIVLFIGAWIIQVILGFIPVLGLLISLVIKGLYVAFIALFSVRFYTLLTGQGAPTLAVSSQPAPPPPPMSPPAAS